MHFLDVHFLDYVPCVPRLHVKMSSVRFFETQTPQLKKHIKLERQTGAGKRWRTIHFPPTSLNDQYLPDEKHDMQILILYDHMVFQCQYVPGKLFQPNNIPTQSFREVCC